MRDYKKRIERLEEELQSETQIVYLSETRQPEFVEKKGMIYLPDLFKQAGI